MSYAPGAPEGKLIECGEGVAVIMPGHDDHRVGIAFRLLGEDIDHPALRVVTEIWLVEDTKVMGHDLWYWRAPEGHPDEAKPYTVWSEHCWPIDIDERAEATS